MQKFGTWPILNDWPLIRSHRLFPWCSNRVMDFEISILARKMNMLVLWFFELPSFCFCQTVVRESLLWVWTFSVSPSTVTHIRGRFRIGFWFDELALNSVSFSFNFGSVQDVSYCRPIRFEYFGEEMNIYQHGVDFSQLFVVIYGPPPVNRPVPPSDPNLDHFEKRILRKN